MIVRENIFEAVNFQRGVDPKVSMGIGKEEVIKQWFRENYNMEPGSELIYDILNDDELPNETKKDWVLFLIERGYHWGYEGWAEMTNKKIDFIPHLPNGFKKTFADIKWIKKNDKNYIQFDWEDFADHIEPSRDYSKEFIESVLSGQSLEYFETDYRPDLADSINWITKDLESVKMIQEKYLELDGDPKIAKTPETMLQDITEREEFEDLHDSIVISLADAEISAEESAAYDHIIERLRDYFQIGTPFWEGNYFEAEIGKTGLERLLSSSFDGEEKMIYSPPYYGYSGKPDYDNFRNNLENKLAEI